MIKLKRTIFIFLLTIVHWITYAAGERNNLQGLGMARTHTVVSRGINTIGINPANLGYTDRSNVSLGLFNMSFGIGSDLIDIKLYKKYFTGDESGNPIYLQEADKINILNIFPGGIAQTGFNFDLKLFSFHYQNEKVGNFALNVLEKMGANILLPKDYVEFLLFGNLLNKKYDFSETYFNVLWYREYSLSYARQIPKFKFMQSMAAGISIKLIHGYGFAELSRNKTFFTTNEDAKLFGEVNYQTKFAGVDLFKEDEDNNFSPFPSPAGSGIGLDIGLTGFVRDELSVGVALIDIGSISWKRNTYEQSGYATFNFDDPKSADEQFDSLDNVLKGTNEATGKFKSRLPAMLRIGFAYQFDKAPFITSFPGELLVALDYNQGFNNLVGNTTIPRFSLGVEYKPWKWLPIRTGFSVGGTDGFNMGFGMGFLFNFMDLEFATENFESVLAPESFDRFTIAIGIKIRF